MNQRYKAILQNSSTLEPEFQHGSLQTILEWCHMLVIPALGKLWHKDHFELKISLGCRATTCLMQTNKGKEREGEKFTKGRLLLGHQHCTV